VVEATEISRVGVVGCGQMGAGIVEVAARAGVPVLAIEETEAGLAAGRARLARSLARAEAAGKLEGVTADEIASRVTWSLSLADAAAAPLVIEAIVEDERRKTVVFGELGRLAPPSTILASNTSSIPITRLAQASGRPERVVGLHFFNPVPVRRLAELVVSPVVDPGVVDVVEAFAADRLGRVVVRVKDEAGFVVNRLLIPYLLAAARLVNDGVATAREVDQAMVEGCGHPLGPLALIDLIGLDTTLAVAESLYEEYREDHLAAPPLLRRLCEAGRLGRKSGQGFYTYTR
jgi:3-hydroxybutyryl-CoA dehydrogenase